MSVLIPAGVLVVLAFGPPLILLAIGRHAKPSGLAAVTCTRCQVTTTPGHVTYAGGRAFHVRASDCVIGLTMGGTR